MSRWRGKMRPRENALGLPALFAGSIRNPSDDEALAVTMSVNATGFALHADDVALGSWGSDEIEIVPLGDRAFEFVAEGDRLIFVPDDLDAFTRRVLPDRIGTRRRRKPSQATTREAPTATAEESPAAEPKAEKRRAEKRRAEKRRAEKRRAEKRRAEERLSEEPSAAPPPPPSKPPAKKKWKRIRGVQVSTASIRRKAEPAKPYELPNDPPPPEPTDSRWLRTLDTARRYGLFSLDRVPVDEKLRGSEHRHTYEHRAAATSGPGHHICTICGKVRLRGG